MGDMKSPFHDTTHFELERWHEYLPMLRSTLVSRVMSY